MDPEHIELDIQSIIAKSASHPVHDTTSALDRVDGLYANTPLPTTESIRLIDISPGESLADPKAPLYGSLRVVDLTSSPCFTALSYVWGAPAPATAGTEGSIIHVSCNGGGGGEYRVPITPNCHDALVALRNHHADGRTLTIWVDAICINQKDDGEKAVQLPLMGTIYTFAEKVFVWLGNGTPGARRTVAWMNHATRRKQAPPGNPWLRGPGKRITVRGDVWRCLRRSTRLLNIASIRSIFWIDLSVIFRLFGVQVPTPDRDDIRELLQNEWLGRIWTFQEILLASNPILVCGSNAITWSRFLIGLKFPKASGFSVKAAFQKAQNDAPDAPDVPDAEIADWSVLSPWMELSDLWAVMYRPSGWNGVALRNIPETPPAGQHKRWSQASYRTIAVPEWLITGLSNLVFGVVFAVPFLLTALILYIKDFNQMIIWASLVLGLGSVSLLCGLKDLLWAAFRASSHHKVVSVSPLSILRALCERQAGEPKDKAYALYGVLSNLGVENLTQPDYKKSLGEVYHGFFLDLINWNPSLVALLAEATSPALPRGTPTWVPDWSTNRERAWLPPQWIYASVDRDISGSYSWPVQYCFTDDRRALELRGAVMGTVKAAFGPFEPTGCGNFSDDVLAQDIDIVASPNLWAGLYTIWRWIFGIRKDVLLAGPHDSVPHAIMFALPAGARDRDDPEALASFNRWYRIMVDCEIQTQETSSQRLAAALRGNVEALRYSISCIDNLAGKPRHLFYTTDGHIGVGPPEMKAGDSVVVLDGVPVPMVLRTTQPGEDDGIERYTVVGPGYVPGYRGVTERQIWNRDTREWEYGNPKDVNPACASLEWKYVRLY